MTAEEALEGLASLAPLEGTALPWPAPPTSDAYVDTLQAGFDQYFQVIFKLDIPELQFGETTVSQARTAYDVMVAALTSKVTAVYSAVAAGKPFVAMHEAVNVPASTLRTFLVLLNAVTWANFQAHEAGAWRWAVNNGKVTLPELQASAESVYRLWALVGKLEKLGALNALKKPQFKGLGEAFSTTAMVVIAITAVAVIAIIAFCLMTLKVESNRDKMIRDTCLDKDGRYLANPPPHCPKYFDNLAKDPNGHLTAMFGPLTDTLNTAIKSIATVAGIGVLLYVGAVFVLPAVVGTFASRRRAPA
jgi:hypothetical protein